MANIGFLIQDKDNFHCNQLRHDETPIAKTIVTLPAPNVVKGSFKYEDTTAENKNDYSKTNPDQTIKIKGPFGFGNGFKLKKNSCLKDNSLNTKDECLKDVRKCPKGFTLSLFIKINYESDPEKISDNLHGREYILSTGGDVGKTGVAIFIQGWKLGAIVSTGQKHWSVETIALPKKGVWTNIGIIFGPKTFNNQTDFDEKFRAEKPLGGLELLIDAKTIAIDPLGEDCSNNCVQSGPLNPMKFVIGCHITGNNETERGFAAQDAFKMSYDEISFWNKSLTDQKSLLLGGYQKDLDTLKSDKVLEGAGYIKTTDPAQAFMGAAIATDALNNDQPATAAAVASRKIWIGEDEETLPSLRSLSNNSSNNGTTASTTTTTTTTTTTPSPTDKMRKLVKLMDTLTKTNDLPEIMSPIETQIRMDTQIPVSIIMSTKKESLKRDWKLLKSDNNEAGGETYKQAMNQYLIYSLSHVNTSGRSLSETLFNKMIVSDNIVANMTKFSIQHFKEHIKTINKDKFPKWSSEEFMEIKKKWGLIHNPDDFLEYPLNILNDSCVKDDSFIDIVTMIQDTVADFGYKNPATILSNQIKILSRLLTVEIYASRIDIYDKKVEKPCFPDENLLKINPIKLSLQHRSVSSLDQTLNDDRIVTTKCVIWNPNLGRFGAWDTEGIVTKFSDKYISTCIATKFGTYGILAEIEDIPYVVPDALWLMIIKSIGFALSIICLMIFICVILLSTYLREMFHYLGVNLAIAILFGHLSMILSEMDVTRSHLKFCLIVGFLISFFYSAAIYFLFFKLFAVFKSLTMGEIGGKTPSYLLLGWGLPMVSLGVNIFLNLDDMGNDPRCFIGWYNNIKWVFFMPISSCLGVSFLLASIVMCNLAFTALRKETIAEELISMAKGLFVFTLLMCLTWGAWGPLAYLRFPGTELPDFYPGFQVLNSFMGLFLFIAIGMGSQRFRTVIFGQVKLRQKQLIEIATEKKKDNRLENENVDQSADYTAVSPNLSLSQISETTIKS